MADTYCWLRLAARPGKDSEALKEAFETRVRPTWAEAGIKPWGLFRGLFGVASNELIVVAAAEQDLALDAFVEPLEARLRDAGDTLAEDMPRPLRLEPTLRPARTDPLNRPGLYVLRSFRVAGKDVDALVALSGEAWTSFETSADYASKPVGLFREKAAPQTAEQTVLLVTWYDGFGSWEQSRQPPAEARERFAQRSALTLETLALATRLVL